MREVVIGTRDLRRCRSDWRKLLTPSGPSSEVLFRAGNGPAIRLVSASSDRIQRIVLEVDSLTAAKEFLAEKHLLGAASAKAITIDPSGIQQLSIHLVAR